MIPSNSSCFISITPLFFFCIQYFYQTQRLGRWKLCFLQNTCTFHSLCFTCFLIPKCRLKEHFQHIQTICFPFYYYILFTTIMQFTFHFFHKMQFFLINISMQSVLFHKAPNHQKHTWQVSQIILVFSNFHGHTQSSSLLT